MHALSGSFASTSVECPHCGRRQNALHAAALAPGYNGIAQRCGYRVCRRPFVVLVRLTLRPVPRAFCVGARAMGAWSGGALEDALRGFRAANGAAVLTSADVLYIRTVFELACQPWDDARAA